MHIRYLVEFPPLEKLMFDQKDNSLALVRLELLKWSLKCDNLRSLDGISDVFVPVVLTLNFIVQVTPSFIFSFEYFPTYSY